MSSRAMVLAFVLAGCRSSAEPREHDRRVDEGADVEEATDNRDNFWRARIVIVGHGDATTIDQRFACHGTAAGVLGACGPVLLRFHERQPPLVRATAALGWRFDHWSSTLTEPDGSTHPRAGRLPDGPLYLNGFGYTDTGELDTVTAVFVPDTDLRSRRWPGT